VRRVPLTIALVLALTGCDFFKELQSENTDETAGTDETADADETADETAGTDGPCDVLDEHCEDQDTLVSCNPETGELVTSQCAALCGDLLNFTCTPTDSFVHGCWCVGPGNIKLATCTELEACIAGCGDPNSTCSQQCFADTDATTIRLLGTLWSCADLSCDEICAEYPGECSGCLASARAGLWGDCGVERSVCDADELDDQPWP
jgi:hypothetical protein